MTSSDDNTCANCKYSRIEDDGDGEMVVECRRYPRAVFVIEDMVASAFPTVEVDDWCAEHVDEWGG